MKNPSIDYEPIFKYAFDNAAIGMAIASLDGRAIKVNAKISEILGYSEEELKEMTFEKYTHQDDLERNVQLIQEVLTGIRDSYEMEKRIRQKNGKYKWISVRVSLVTDESGQPKFFISQTKDITDEKRIELKLHEIDRQNQMIADHSLDIIAIHNRDGRCQFISSACKTLLGYEPEELIGKSCFAFCHPEDQKYIQRHIREISKGKNISPLLYRVRRKDGEYRWLETTAKGIVNDTGKMIEILSFTRDITRRKQSELLLKESEIRYKSLFDYHPDMIFSMDLMGYYTSINHAFQKVLGYKEQEILHGKFSFLDLFSEDFVEQARFHFNLAASGIVQRFEATALNKNKKPIVFDVTNIPIIVDGKVVGVYGIARNISYRKQAEKNLKETKKQLESFIDHNIDPILIFNKDGFLVKVNEAFETTYGWKGYELLGQTYFSLPFIPLEELDGVENYIQRIKQGSKIKKMETKRLKKDGTLISVDASGFPIRDEEGGLIAWAIILRDISDAKLAEEMMINSEKLSIAGQLAAGIAHEIRNPMTAIKGFIQLMRPEYTTKKQYFDIITAEIERIETIVSELLILSKPQELNYTKTDILLLLSEITTLLKTQAILKNVEIIGEYTSTPIYIYCEKNQIKQVCINIIKNGIEAMPDGGEIRIQVKKEKDGVILSFLDEGVGISKELLEKLGEPFYTTKEKGTGLGFMVSKKIIENHGGNIKVSSELGKGTTIEVYLPSHRKK
ncbi:PAS domain-containing sensor histidine kinase [Evansella tamaricis]|uniref:histidine kinase n=1 Tax=Evansella tamaricis TaxID=2069301 RepID=A0ABS6JKM6_9BACI|nr:PAS domain-containing sensor histidine kinase [Evansella tamaricis]MBU9714208.1 PAS domain S-box protein [Evansella tamaricis]